MSLSITGYMTGLVLPWITTKATPLQIDCGRASFRNLTGLFLRTLRQALTAFATIALAAASGAAMLSVVAPRLATRMVSAATVRGAWLLAAGANCVVQSLGTLLRSFKREPFLVQSMAVAALTLAAGRVDGAAMGQHRRPRSAIWRFRWASACLLHWPFSFALAVNIWLPVR